MYDAGEHSFAIVIEEEKAMFPLTAFTSDVVSRLTGLSVSQLHRWDRSQFFVPMFADPDRRRPSSRVYSFSDVVALRTIAKLREMGVSFPELKKARAFFASEANEHWASRRFFVVGNRLFFTHDDAIVAARPPGHRIMPDVLDLGEIVQDVQAAVAKLSERTPDQIGQITHDRLIMNGAPVLAGTRIPTANIAWWARNGYSDTEIQHEFPRLHLEDIRSAVAFEDAPEVAVRELVAAAG